MLLTGFFFSLPNRTSLDCETFSVATIFSLHFDVHIGTAHLQYVHDTRYIFLKQGGNDADDGARVCGKHDVSEYLIARAAEI